MDKTVYIALIVSFVLTAIVMPLLIPVLHRLKFGQTIREIGPKWHEKKNGTPTIDVITPIGNSIGAIIFLATVSDANNNNAPTKDDVGANIL